MHSRVSSAGPRLSLSHYTPLCLYLKYAYKLQNCSEMKQITLKEPNGVSMGVNTKRCALCLPGVGVAGAWPSGRIPFLRQWLIPCRSDPFLYNTNLTFCGHVYEQSGSGNLVRYKAVWSPRIIMNRLLVDSREV